MKKNMWENFFWISVSYLFSPIFYGIIFLNKIFRKKKIKILISTLAKIGDLVCTTPVFRTIKENFPSSHISLLVIPRVEGILRNNPYIDEFIFWDSEKNNGFLKKIKFINMIRKKGFNWSLNIDPSSWNNLFPFWAGVPSRITTTSRDVGRGVKLLFLFSNYKKEYKRSTLKLRHNLELLDFLGIKKFSEKKDVFIDKKEEEKAQDFLKKENLGKDDFIVGISATAGRRLKEWEPHKFSQLADKLIKEMSAKVIFFGTGADRALLEGISKRVKNKTYISTDLKLNELPAFLKHLSLFISVDTGPLYIAHALGVPIVDIAGPVDINEQPPQDRKSEIVQKNIYCVPCSFLIPGARHCKEGHHRCVKEITVDDVLNAVKKLVRRFRIHIKK